MSRSFISYPLSHGLLADLKSDEFPTQLCGWNDGGTLNFFPGNTDFGYVYEGKAILYCESTGFLSVLRQGMYYAITGAGSLLGQGKGISITRLGYEGMFSVGGTIEKEGRLRYIDGCKDSLLIPPVVKGDPCLNALYFPPGINQTSHTHPSMRVGMVVSGSGECLTPDEIIPLEPGQVFVIPSGGLHSFRTTDQPMVVVAWHPESADYGPTHELHPMIQRTFVNGVSASFLEGIQTRG